MCDDSTGYDTVDSTPPRLAARYHNVRLSINRSAARPPPRRSNDTIIPKSFICRRATLWAS